MIIKNVGFPLDTRVIMFDMIIKIVRNSKSATNFIKSLITNNINKKKRFLIWYKERKRVNNWYYLYLINSSFLIDLIHNFDVRRKDDGTTAAERFFGARHENLFESLVTNVRIPSKPQKQHHDIEKRLLGWKKRQAA